MSLRNMPRKYCTKKLINKVKQATSTVYENSVDTYMKSKEIDMDLREELVSCMRNTALWFLKVSLFGASPMSFTTEEIATHKEIIDNMYIEGIIKLPTDIIEDIIFCHNKNKFKRTQRTIEMLVNELTRRALLDDISQ
jgi:Glu-tRNA(Gln) amidotransferase subunit E-like FAD-binding protein